jgi:FdhE protein
MQSQPIDFQPPAAEAAPFLLPVSATVFAERADRFAALADGHSLGDWLAFLGCLTRAQHDALQALPVLPLPDAATLEQARTHGMPPLNAGSLPRPAAWREILRQLAKDLGHDAPEAARRALEALLAADDARLDKLAETLLSGEPQPGDAAALPFVAAALQVVFTVLHCSLCNSEWNVPRAICTACDTDQGVALHEVEGSKGAVRAETCDACKSYLKIVYQERDPRVDPVADDLATLALDMLVDEAGYERSGPNLLLIGANAA